ncbi:MAG: glycosyltransferase family A protein [Bacteroidota bacterium]
MTVSAIVPVYNGRDHLADALASIVAQTCPPTEVVVVDDGSTDGSADLAASIAETASVPIRVIRQDNAGVAAARNAAVAESQRDVFAFLDQDDRWTPDKLAAQLAALEADPVLGFVTARQSITLEPGCERPSWLRPEMLDGPQDGTLPGTLVVRREAFAAIGPFNPEYRTGSDADWFIRATEAGVASQQLDDVLLLRRVHDRNESQRVEQNNRELLHMLRASLRRRDA